MVKAKKRALPIDNPKVIHPSWDSLLRPLFEDVRYQRTREIVLKLHNHNQLTPHAAYLYRVFKQPAGDVRVLIFGLSPYWTKTKLNKTEFTRTAIGRAFAIPPTTNEKKLSPSLSVIIDALRVQYNHPAIFYSPDAPFDVTLEHWEKQGVLLLNRYLSSELDNKNSTIHQPYWDWFTKGLIKNMSEQLNAIVFHFWGNNAKELVTQVDTKKHYIVTASHPQASNYNTDFDFASENVFLKTDEILENLNKETIKWF